MSKRLSLVFLSVVLALSLFVGCQLQQGTTGFDAITLKNGESITNETDGQIDFNVSGTPVASFSATEADIAATTFDVGAASIDALTVDVGTEQIGLPTLITEAITYTAGSGVTGTLATIEDGEIWLVHSVFIQTTETFTDTAGNDETFTIGDGNDENGFIDAATTELSSTFTEATGFAAGFYGIENGSSGAYTLDDGGPFVYAPSGADETIDRIFVSKGARAVIADRSPTYDRLVFLGKAGRDGRKMLIDLKKGKRMKDVATGSFEVVGDSEWSYV
jgi:hypothetical protein